MRSFLKLFSGRRRRRPSADVPALSFSDSQLDLTVSPTLVDFSNSARLLDELGKGAASSVIKEDEVGALADVEPGAQPDLDKMLSTLGPYTCVGQLRSYAPITVVRHRETGQLVAIKKQEVRSPRKRDDVVYPNIHETTIIQMLSDAQMPGHKYIVKFVGHVLSIDTNVHLLATEYCWAGNLFDFLKGAGACSSMRQRLGLARDFTAGLQYIHSLNVAHRDFKHENLFLDYDRREERFVVKIGDFGMSTIASDQSSFSDKPGSPFYAAPELLEFGGYSPLPADVWAYGVAIYVMFQMEYPFDIGYEDGSVSKWALDIIIMRLGELTFTNPAVQKLLGNFINEIFQYEPSARPTMNLLAQNRFFHTHSEPITRSDYDVFVAQRSLK